MTSLPPLIKFQPLDSNGAIIPGGKVYTYAAGTSTPLATYESDGTTPNTNPIILDAYGACNIRLADSPYKFNVTDALDVQIPGWPIDNIENASSVVFSALSASTGASLIGFKRSETSAEQFTLGEFHQTRTIDVVTDFGADPTGVNPASDQIQAAIDSIRGYYEGGTAIKFPNKGQFYIDKTLYISLTRGGKIRFVCDGTCTFKLNDLVGTYALEVDYYTGATANYIDFSMSGISFNDTGAVRDKNGVLFKRVLRGMFERCTWNNLNTAIDMGYDSNMNQFVNCEWRGNNTGWKSTYGVSNNNIFTNCIWEYHYATALDSTGTSGNIVNGGDFEPGNASPVIIANNMRLNNVRFERNNSSTIVRLLSGNTVNACSIYSDGATQALPCVEVTGTNNIINFTVLSGARGINMLSTSSKNKVYINRVITIANIIDFIVDQGTNNVFHLPGSIQSETGIYEFVTPDKLVTDDLSDAAWVKTNCTAVADGTGGYVITGTGGVATVSTTLSGTYNGINLALTAYAVNNSGQAAITIGAYTTSYIVTTGNKNRCFICQRNYNSATITNPVITITLAGTSSGGACHIWNLRSSSGEYLPD